MRVIIPNYCTPDSFEENVTVTLQMMGHEVLNMGQMSIHLKSSPYYRLYRDLKSKIFKAKTDQEKWLLLNVDKFKPHLVLSLTQSLPEEVLHEVRSKGVKAVSWWGDTAANMVGKGLCHREWDLIFIKDHYAAFKLKSLNLPAFQMFEAMNPLWHQPIAKQRNNQVVIAGTFYDYRHLLTTMLIENSIDVGLYGARLPVWASSEIRNRHTGRFITKEDKSRIFGESMAVLNSTAMREFASVNCRAFEVAGCGGLQIMEYRDSITECFEPEKEILLFSNFDELLGIIEKATKFPNEMESIRRAAAARALNCHTYQHRLDFIFDKLKSI